MVQTKNLKNNLIRILIATVVLVVLIDILFYKQGLGINMCIFTFTFILVTYILFPDIIQSTAGNLLILFLSGAAVTFILHVKTLAVIYSIIGMIILLMTARAGWTNNLQNWLFRWQNCFNAIFRQWFDDYQNRTPQQTAGKENQPPKKGSSFSQWLGILFISLIFIIFFSLANPIFNKYARLIYDNLIYLIKQIPELFSIPRILLWALSAMVIWGLLRFKIMDKMEKRQDQDTLKPTAAVFLKNSLIVFNLIFLVETILDILYLWGGATLPEGITYAQYAHKGAYPLIAVVLLSGIFVLITFKNIRGLKFDLLKKLVSFWLLQNIFLTFSAAFRLYLYIRTYYLTLLRLSTIVWLLIVMIGLLTIIIKIVFNKSNSWLLKINIINLASIIYITLFFNFKSAVAWYNVKHCQEITGQGVQLDIIYLTELGPATLPALFWLSGELHKESIIRLDVELSIKALTCYPGLEKISWQEWTLNKAKIKKLLDR